jgi:peptidyl-prolyl cis-trans isomerase SurA
MAMDFKRFLLFVAVGFILLFPFPSQSEVLDRIVALVNNEVITLSELEQAGRNVFEEVRQNTPAREQATQLKSAHEEILDQLIENKLLEQEMRNKKIEVSDRDVDMAIQDIMKENKLNENELKIALAKNGMTYSIYRQQLRNDIGKMRLVTREIKSKIVIKEEDLRKKYSENLKEYTEPLMVKVQQIFLPFSPGATEEEISAIRQEAQDILERARKGEDFSKLAATYSRGPEAKEGGVLGFFKPEELKPEMKEAVIKLSSGAVSDLIRSSEGFHILRVMERRGGEPKPFVEVQNKIRNEMIQAESERQFKDWMKALKAKAYIEVRLSPPASPNKE